MEVADVVVVGLGAAGAATLLQLARRGVRAVGIDRHSPPHVHGSTHGESRITRLAIGEGEAYTPLVMRSHAIWREIEAETGTDLLTQCGVLIVESRGSTHSLHGAKGFLDRTIACANRYGIDHEVLTAAQIADRFAQFAVAAGDRAYFEPSAGFVRPEACVAAQLDLAVRDGATVCREEQVLEVTTEGTGVRVRTDRDTYHAGHAVLSAGPWLPDLLPGALRPLFTVYPQMVYWYGLRGGAGDHSPATMPSFIWATADSFFYGAPAIDGPAGGVKAASEQFDITTTPASAAHAGRGESSTALYDRLLAARMPGLSGACVKELRCLYTTTPDHNFVVDRHPDIAEVLIASPCSGHGFKHSAGLGEAIAELVTAGSSAADLSSFRLERFSL
jgi:sarcosine oxidase